MKNSMPHQILPNSRQVQKLHNANFTCKKNTFRTIPRGLGGSFAIQNTYPKLSRILQSELRSSSLQPIVQSLLLLTHSVAGGPPLMSI